MNGIKHIENLITEVSKEVFINLLKHINVQPGFSVTEIKYHESQGKFYTLIAFQLYRICKAYNVNTTINDIAAQITCGICTADFCLTADNGFINIELSNAFIDNEIELIAGKNASLQGAVPYFAPFSVWYAINKIQTGLVYLWDEKLTIRPSEEDQTKKIAVYVIYLDSQKSILMPELDTLARKFYEYDRALTGIKIPYTLYKACLSVIIIGKDMHKSF